MRPQVLEGVKVADFSLNAASPLCSRELAEHGATVVRIETHRRPDACRLTSPFMNFFSHPDHSIVSALFNTNKYGITLDLNKSMGQEIARKLVLWADVVMEAFIPGTMAKWGLDYEECKKLKPDIIYTSSCQHGQQGPYSQIPGYGTFSSAMGGFSDITGYSDRAPSNLNNAYTDFISPWYLVIGILLALLHRHKTGNGMYIDQAQVEAGMTFLGPALLDCSVNGHIATRMGNHDPYMTPHNAYPCKGEDCWVVIAVSTEEEWKAFCRVIDMPWTNEERFSTFVLRRKNEADLDTLMGEWTIKYTPREVMTRLQKEGIPAGIVAKGEDLFKDPQLKHREHFQYLEHKCIGSHVYNSPAYKLSETPSRLWKAANCLGEDNFYVYKEILGLSEDEISELVAEGVITTEADLPSVPQS